MSTRRHPLIYLMFCCIPDDNGKSFDVVLSTDQSKFLDDDLNSVLDEAFDLLTGNKCHIFEVS